MTDYAWIPAGFAACRGMVLRIVSLCLRTARQSYINRLYTKTTSPLHFFQSLRTTYHVWTNFLLFTRLHGLHRCLYERLSRLSLRQGVQPQQPRCSPERTARRPWANEESTMRSRQVHEHEHGPLQDLYSRLLVLRWPESCFVRSRRVL